MSQKVTLLPGDPLAVDTRAYRQAMGSLAKGVTLLATGQGEGLRVMTASAVNSLSLEPLLILVCLDKRARFIDALQQQQGFSINVLRRSQEDLSSYFAGMWQRDLPPAFEFLPWPGGPLLRGCAAATGCRLYNIVEGGDHWIVIGEVLAVHIGPEPVDPLIFYRGRYRHLAALADPHAREVEDSALWYFPW